MDLSKEQYLVDVLKNKCRTVAKVTLDGVEMKTQSYEAWVGRKKMMDYLYTTLGKKFRK